MRRGLSEGNGVGMLTVTERARVAWAPRIAIEGSEACAGSGVARFRAGRLDCRRAQNLVECRAMTRTVKCAKLGETLPGLPYKPFNDALGQRIYDNVSAQAWHAVDRALARRSSTSTAST